MDEYKFDVKLVYEDYRSFFRRNFFGRRNLVMMLVIYIFILLFDFLVFFKNVTTSIEAFIFTIVFISIGIYYGGLRGIKKSLKTNKFFGVECVYIINNDGVSINSEISNMKMPWDMLYKISESNEIFLFYISPNCAYLLPKRCFLNKDQVNSLRELLKSKANDKSSFLQIV